MRLSEEIAGLGYCGAQVEPKSRWGSEKTKAPYRKVYFVRHLDTGAIKIGRSNDPNRRLKQLRRTFGGRMELIGFVAGAITETTLIRHLSQWAIGKEWFRPSAEVDSVVETCLEKGLAEAVELAKFYSFGD